MAAHSVPARRAVWVVALAIGVTVALSVGCAFGSAEAGKGVSPDPTTHSAVSSSSSSPRSAGAPTIIDHSTIHLAQVPLEWIEAAKSRLHVVYGHSSHGSQITTGMSGLMTFANAPHGGSAYAWNDGGTGGALDIDDAPFVIAADLGNPEWATETRSYLNDPANADVNVVMWSWCGQLGQDSTDVAHYLDLMSGLEQDYPDVTFVYMTGHTDGGGLAGTLHTNNQQIRNYCTAHGKFLYDFEDIESYDPDGRYFGNLNVADSCDYKGGNWAIEWQNAHVRRGGLVRLRVRAHPAPQRQSEGLRCLVAVGSDRGMEWGHRDHRTHREWFLAGLRSHGHAGDGDRQWVHRRHLGHLRRRRGEQYPCII